MKFMKKQILFIVLCFTAMMGMFMMPSNTKAASIADKVYLGKYKLTAYCNCKKCSGKYAGGKTASGTVPKQGRTVAVDKSKIRLGTNLHFNGSTYRAEDTGSGVKGNHIDVFFQSHKSATNFGRKNNVKVYKVLKTKKALLSGNSDFIDDEDLNFSTDLTELPSVDSIVSEVDSTMDKVDTIVNDVL